MHKKTSFTDNCTCITFNLKTYVWRTKKVTQFSHPTYKSKNAFNKTSKHKTCLHNT